MPHIDYSKTFFKVLFVVGPTGSSASDLYNSFNEDFLLKTSFTESLNDLITQIEKPSLKEYDDTFIERLIKEYQGIKNSRSIKEIIRRGLGLIVDATGISVEDLVNCERGFRSLGFDTSMIFINAPINSLNDSSIDAKKSWRELHENLGTFNSIFSDERFIVIDTFDYGRKELKIKNLFLKSVKNLMFLKSRSPFAKKFHAYPTNLSG